MNVWIITVQYGGVPEEPLVFSDEAKARQAWAEIGGPGDDWYYTDDHDFEAWFWDALIDESQVLEPKCEVTDCPTEGPVNEHGVCEACWEAIPVGCSCGSGIPPSDEDWMKGCCEECYGSWAEGIREHFKGASE